jgi:ubiquinone/menaquinone biosynthesis C-methylase UbiE
MWTLAQRFIDFNRRISGAIGRQFPHSQVILQREYPGAVAAQVRSASTILDVGAGREVPYRSMVPPGTRIIGVDLSAERLAQNDGLSQAIVADLSQPLPLKDSSVDMVVSRAVLEHLRDVDGFLAEAARVLKPGGVMVHMMPSRFAPFAILNRWIPNRLTRWLIATFEPYHQQTCGYPAYYDRCWPGGMTRSLRARGFRILELRVQYYSSGYYAFFFPLYAASIVYEWVLWRLRLEGLCAVFLVVAKKDASPRQRVEERSQDTGATAPDPGAALGSSARPVRETAAPEAGSRS